MIEEFLGHIQFLENTIPKMALSWTIISMAQMGWGLKTQEGTESTASRSGNQTRKAQR